MVVATPAAKTAAHTNVFVLIYVVCVYRVFTVCAATIANIPKAVNSFSKIFEHFLRRPVCARNERLLTGSKIDFDQIKPIK